MTDLAIVIPTRGRSGHLTMMLRSLDEAIPLGATAKAVVVVDGDDDIAPCLVGLSLDVTVVRLGRRRGPAHARNVGAAVVDGDVLAFLDDDVVIPIHWYRDVRAVLGQDPGGWDAAVGVPSDGTEAGPNGSWQILGGDIRSVRPHNLVSQMFEALVIRHALVDGRWFLSTANVLIRRAAFDALGGFDERFPDAAGEDWDLCRRAHAVGVTVGATGRFHVLHRNPTRLREVVSRARRYAASSPRRFAPWRPVFDGTEDRLVRVVRTVRNPLKVVLSPITVLLPNYFRRAAEVRRRGHGWFRTAMILVVHVPWFLAYSVTSYRALRSHRATGAGVLLALRPDAVER